VGILIRMGGLILVLFGENVEWDVQFSEFCDTLSYQDMRDRCSGAFYCVGYFAMQFWQMEILFLINMDFSVLGGPDRIPK